MEPKSSEKISKLDRKDIQTISTSQVIANLSGACRELIDNALDADASTIEIKASEFGVKQLEVVDNGHGILSSNFKALCKPHSTSKLAKFEDFDTLLTFGFRGEALNALAALSEVTIITRHTNESKATRLKFNFEGEIVEQSNCARTAGTTVILSKLFSRLPVRQKHLQSTARDQFQKLLNCVQAFALSRTDVRFLVSNTLGTKVNQILTTKGGDSNLKSVIVNLFGARSEKEAMLEIQNGTLDSEILELYGLQPTDINNSIYNEIQIHGYVSSCMFGCGRYMADRQFIFVNNRPVDYAKICKVVNETYNLFNRGHYATTILFIDLNPKHIDVNVTPDKRQVFLKIEKEVFAKLKSCLLTTFQSVAGKCLISKVLQSTQSQVNVEHINNTRTDAEKQKLSADQARLAAARLLPSTHASRDPSCAEVSRREVLPPSVSKASTSVQASETRRSNSTLQNLPARPLKITQIVASNNGQSQFQVFDFKDEELDLPPDTRAAFKRSFPNSTAAMSSNQTNNAKQSKRTKMLDDVNDDVKPLELSESSKSTHSNTSFKDENVDVQLNSTQPCMNSLARDEGRRLSIEHSVDMQETSATGDIEKRLSLMLKKEDFGRMKVVGQFNKAFILTQLEQHLFIIDQHASDEKYNFERLQQTHKIQHQRLITPKKVELGAVYESVICDNLNMFRQNGFDFEFNENETPGHRVKLLTIPCIHGHMFGISDIQEIAGVLNVYPGTVYRPEKIRKIFASWACRSSIMIGTALNSQQMYTVVRNMGKIENPWSCPHGRPTIRHLCELQFSLTMSQLFQPSNFENEKANENEEDE